MVSSRDVPKRTARTEAEPPAEADEVKPPFISQGVKNDIEQHGWTVDPLTGRKLTRADLP